jgi:hypothetical protein
MAPGQPAAPSPIPSRKGRGEESGWRYLRAADGIPVIIGMHIIIGMPPHIIIIGMPAAIMAIMRWQASLNMSIDMPSPGMTLQVMASPLMSQVIFIIGTGIGIMPAIMGIMPGIIGIMPGIIPLPIIGIMPPPIMGIIPFIIGIMPPIIGMAPPIIGDMLPPMAPIGICIAVIIGSRSLASLQSRQLAAGRPWARSHWANT